MAVQPCPGPSYPLQWYVLELPLLLGLCFIPQFSWRKARVASFLRVSVEAKIIPLTRGGCPPLPPPNEAMRVRVLCVLLLLLLLLLPPLLLFVHAGVCCVAASSMDV